MTVSTNVSCTYVSCTYGTKEKHHHPAIMYISLASAVDDLLNIFVSTFVKFMWTKLFLTNKKTVIDFGD